MDCVNHRGVQRRPIARTAARRSALVACARTWRTDTLRTLLDGVAELPTAIHPAAPSYPNPSAAAVLGLIPGVGAMYNGQFFKGFIHVVVFAVLVSNSHHSGVFGLFVAAWVVYQVFEAYHTAKARRDGEPLPDPIGLNELAGWFHTGIQTEFRRRAHGVPPPTAPPVAGAASAAPPYAPAPGYAPAAGYAPAGWRLPTSGLCAALSAALCESLSERLPAAAVRGACSGVYRLSAGGISPCGLRSYPPGPPSHWRRPEPIAAIILIGLGALFLLGQMDWFSGRVFEYMWPLLFIGLGAWLLFRRMNAPRPFPGAAPVPPAAPPAESGEGSHEIDKNSQGGTL